MEKDKFRALEDWLISNGGKFPKLELKVLLLGLQAAL